MKIRTIIIDDNVEILNSLEKHLSHFDYIDLIYSTLDSEDFLEVVLEQSPDLVIMDIDMPRLNGIELGNIIREKLPFIEIVYVTSHSEYIKDAFNVYASDFIEKPYDIDRLNLTLKRISKKLNVTEETYEIKSQRIIRHLRVSEIICIEAFNRKTTIYTDTETIEADYSLKGLLTLLNSKYLYKSARSFCINLLKVDSVKSVSRTSYEISFKNSKVTALLSKNQYNEFRELFKKILS